MQCGTVLVHDGPVHTNLLVFEAMDCILGVFFALEGLFSVDFVCFLQIS